MSLKKLSAILSIMITLVIMVIISCAYASQDTIGLFPLEHYDQTISTWINPSDPGYDKPLLSERMQQDRMTIFYDHYFGEFSPWSESYINTLFQLTPPDDLTSVEIKALTRYSNDNQPAEKIGYGENFRPHTAAWIADIQDNINLSAWNTLSYQKENRGIAVDNLHARALPTNDVHFYSYQLPGQGYPFDNLQISSLWAGTPVYILAESKDHAWLLVATSDYIAWVESKGIARVNDAFISTWQTAAKNNLAAITHTHLAIVDKNNHFLFDGYVGAVFPATPNGDQLQLMVPAMNENHDATIKYALVSNNNATMMPLSATPHHISTVMSTLIGRPYGWGGSYFYNDCSSELKSLFTPFGIWLPRHSSYQVTVGHMVDMTNATPEKRLAYLIDHGKPLLTLVYIGSHIVLYVGTFPDPNNPDAKIAMTYQNVWGLSPSSGDRRAVIGQSLLFPMLLEYPEDKSLVSLANRQFFQISFLDQLPDPKAAAETQRINLKSMISAEAVN